MRLIEVLSAVVASAAVVTVIAVLSVSNTESVPLSSVTSSTASVADSTISVTSSTALDLTDVITSSTRPPLDDPPDPGPVPKHHAIAAADLAKAVSSSVRVSGIICNALSEGSGFAVSEDDLIATNAHVIVGMAEPVVELADGRELPGELVAFDAVNDLAVLRVTGAGLDPLPLAHTAPDGTIGAMLGWRYPSESDPTHAPAPSPFRIDRPVVVRTDIVAGTERVERRSWLVAGRIESGHSGAALIIFDSGQVKVVGIAWGASRLGLTDVGYATRADELDKLLATTDLSKTLELPMPPESDRC